MSFNQSEEVNMTQPFDLDDIRADADKGTPGPWREGPAGNLRVYGPDGKDEHSGLVASISKGRVDVRRIARVPSMEAEILRLTAENERLREGCISAAAALSATISLLERGGKKAAASNTMFEQMLKDYQTHLDTARLALGWTTMTQTQEQAPTYAEGYADALEAAASEMELGAHTTSYYGSDMQVKTFQDAAKIIRALPIKEKPMCDPLSDPRVKALVEALNEYATHRQSGIPWNPKMPKVYVALAALQKEQET